MTRTKSHFQEKEPILEMFLQKLRFNKVIPFVKKGYKIIDFGCGYNGTLLNILSPKISEGLGVDVSVTKRKTSKNIRLISNNSFRSPKDYFDLAVSLAVLEHLEKPDNLLKSAFNSLKKNGKLILTTPSPIAKPILEFLAFRLKVVSEQEIKDHKKYYGKKDVEDLLTKAGFKTKNIHINYFTFGLNTFVTAKK